jgi:2-oxoglutarate dehydrogenase E2 component (dihydrolipoamide succinyltransferase)
MKHEVKVPSAGESINEVEIGTWLKEDGDIVSKDDILVELESQKANFELQSEFSGRLEIVKADAQTTVKIGEVIAYIDDSVSSGSSKKSSSDKKESKESSDDIRTTPASKKIMNDQNIDPKSIEGTGKRGQILKQDLVNQPKSTSPKNTPTTAKDSAVTTAAYNYVINSERGEKAKPASSIRRHIAKNLVAAQHTAAILTTFNEVDMTSVMEYRKKNKEKFKEKHGTGLGMVGFFALACAKALKEYPDVNATFTGEEIIYRDYVDLSVAVSTDRGLVVPVMKDIQKMDLADFEKSLSEISDKAKNKKLSINDMTGGTFTISNGGVFGSLVSTPILNMPQSAILGLHKIEKRPIVVDDEIVIRPMMYLALSYDHRIIDGKEAVLFLVKVKECIEDLSLILEE